MVVFDATVLVDLFQPVRDGERRQRIDLLMADLAKRQTKIIVPAPAYSEFMVKAGHARGDYQKRIEKSRGFRVEPFGARAALECAFLLDAAFTMRQRQNVTKTKFKFDWMIVAIAKATPGVTCIYSGDDDIVSYSQWAGVMVIHLDSLSLPAQRDWVADSGHGAIDPSVALTPR
jgi:predicted nucleic acid-binding protein